MNAPRVPGWFERLFVTQVALLRRVGLPLAMLLFVFVGGTVGYQLLGAYYERPWTLLQCAYMTAITLTTVGYGDELGVTQLDGGRIYTMFLLLAGMGATLYSVSAITAFVVEGHVSDFFKGRRIEMMITNTIGHTIVCGAGTTGIHVVEELKKSGRPFVVVDTDKAALDHLQQVLGVVPFLQGDATDEDVLERAGLSRAKSLVACLNSDKDNLFLTVTAHYVRPELPITVKCMEHHSVGKFKAAGATHVVSPTFIGGMRLASHVIRPQVVAFLDAMLRGNASARVSESIVEDDSALCGKTIGEARVRERVGLTVVAMKRKEDQEFTYSPSDDARCPSGTALIVIGPVDAVRRLDAMCSKDGVAHPAPVDV